MAMSKSNQFKADRVAYSQFSAMKDRCHNANNTHYANYGGRGISVCQEWRSYGGYYRFIEHMGPPPTPHHTIDRINNDGNYEPGNVRWATRKEQQRNRRGNRNITYKGKTQCARAWADEFGISYTCMNKRLTLNWPMERIEAMPTGVKSNGYGLRMITHDGRTLSLAEWSRCTGIKEATIRKRLKSGWSVADALTMEVGR